MRAQATMLAVTMQRFDWQKLAVQAKHRVAQHLFIWQPPVDLEDHPGLVDSLEAAATAVGPAGLTHHGTFEPLIAGPTHI